MKLAEVLKNNAQILAAQIKELEQRLGRFQEEVQKVATELNEVQQQLVLCTKVQETLKKFEAMPTARMIAEAEAIAETKNNG